MPIVLHGTALEADLAVIREKHTPLAAFRSAISRIGLHLAVEVSKHLPAKSIDVTTPLTTTKGVAVSSQIVVVPVLRAGLGLLDAFLQIIPKADVGFIGLQRDEDDLSASEYYRRFPETHSDSTLIVLDPMLATGGSLISTVEALSNVAHKHIFCACVIAAPEGIEAFENRFPEVQLTVAAVDSHLNTAGFIVPGLGDAGDRLFGT